MKPQLAAPLGPKFSRFPCFVQPKLDGVRALYQSSTFQSRGEKLWKPTFFPHIVDELYSHFNTPVIFDGEFYHDGWKLQRINSAVGVNNNNPNEDTPNIEFHIFDVVDPAKNFSQRWLDYYHLIQSANLPHVKAVPTAYAESRATMDLHFFRYTELGYEGLMARPDGPYVFGATSHGTRKNSPFLWKYKKWSEDEWYCVGWTPGEGKADIGIGALVFALKGTAIVDNGDGTKTIHGQTFKVGTGFDDKERIYYMIHPPIGKRCRIRYLFLTDAGIPFNPSFIACME